MAVAQAGHTDSRHEVEVLSAIGVLEHAALARAHGDAGESGETLDPRGQPLPLLTDDLLRLGPRPALYHAAGYSTG